MRTITTRTTVYKFEELSEKGKEKALENLYDINVNHDWWDSTYDDAKNIGCEIREFDTGRGSYCRLTCPDTLKTARLIVSAHGETCDTHKLAAEYLKNYDALDRDEDGETIPSCELDDEFTRALGEEYLSILRAEYEYQTSEESIIETILANEYEFTEDGTLKNV